MKSWEYYNKIADNYDEMYAEPYWEMHNKVSEKIIFDNINIKKGKILDIGAGTGYWSKIFLEKGFDVYAVEPSERMCEILENRFSGFNNIKIINGYGENLPLEDNMFDIVLAMGDVLSYAENQEEFIDEVNRVLKKDGYFIGTVDNLNKFIFDAFFSKDFDIIEVMKKKKRIKIGSSKFMSFYSTLFTKNDLEKILSQFFKNINIYGIMPFSWEGDSDFSKYWAEVLELEIKFSKSLFDVAEHLMYLVVK
ncbi:methyltransferase, FkbM family [Marinitoga hydrogenitolerans DSM 16785]|uniref:Methyltransferase, FkbM family n=1 Tax=Marinitoga hydrogenitolerans (strain DSM 16785 / JCM 12826 / AT1271) TaxID=1122195 RepID=A0A1M4U760_MARH1|nr:class I SAM-dependent methyltransferase [Marinitoga hydrogenitolerans]SHE52602.1 methyltransferase, FkbM family [Marinitoga hydrogenitolerans DSM 16785]